MFIPRIPKWNRRRVSSNFSARAIRTIKYLRFEECTLSDPEEHPPLLNELAKKCPPYARASCATATSWHLSYANELDEIEEDFRHCSPFTRFPQTECNENSIQGLEHLNCKNTCTSEACNTKRIERGLQCYQCQATRGFEGRGVGLGPGFTNIPVIRLNVSGWGWFV